MTIRNELLDELLAGQDLSSVMRQDGLLGALKKALPNRLMVAEFEHHLSQDRTASKPASCICCATPWPTSPGRTPARWWRG